MGHIIKKIFTYALLPAAIIVLAYFNVTTITYKLDFDNAVKSREDVAKQRLFDLRELQKNYKLVYGNYAPNLDSLVIFYNEATIPTTFKAGDINDTTMAKFTDSVVTALKKDKRYKTEEALDKELYRLYKSGSPYKDLLVFDIDEDHPVRNVLFVDRPDFNIDEVILIPYSEGERIWMEVVNPDSTSTAPPAYELRVPYKSLLKGLDEQLVLNLITEKTSSRLYPGLKLGDLKDPNKLTGNWE